MVHVLCVALDQVTISHPNFVSHAEEGHEACEQESCSMASSKKREGQKQEEGNEPQATPKCEESRLCSPLSFCSKKGSQETSAFGPLRPGPREHDRPQPLPLSSQRWYPTSMGRSSLSSLCAWHSEHHVLLQGTQGVDA